MKKPRSLVLQGEVIHRGPFDMKILQNKAKEMDLTKEEGFTVRLTSSFKYENFSKSLTKFVRAGHVQPDKPKENADKDAPLVTSHWLERTYPNKLTNPANVKPAYMAQNKKYTI